MSALGHKRTFAVQKDMSALPPKADIHTRIIGVRFAAKADKASNSGALKRYTEERLGTIARRPVQPSD